eukprot:gnl/TRDRNA2_/TRDRNA2_83110_c0_seq1.p1 gnl/TRDRNA2_/TRDRNA2_83110_c0~~gnl/TRDRNA2_/TRDRNA2_83110_c0_seq1.p1  ORF type:complete len:405 (+),score=51.80 gnl/TRDRNA2_/TRDRNA2_83110_c0_seq1:695-1909(+)
MYRHQNPGGAYWSAWEARRSLGSNSWWIPTSKSWRRLLVCMGGEAQPWVKQLVDIDIAAVFYSKRGKNLGAVCADNLMKYGLTHCGDDGGEHGTNDEAISVDIAQVPAVVAQIFFVVHVYTEGATFKEVLNAYCRITDESCTELAYYEMDGGDEHSGLVVCRLFRTGEHWGLQAMGSFCSGPTWQHAKKDLAKLFSQPTSEGRRGSKDVRPRGDGELSKMTASAQDAPADCEVRCADQTAAAPSESVDPVATLATETSSAEPSEAPLVRSAKRIQTKVQIISHEGVSASSRTPSKGPPSSRTPSKVPLDSNTSLESSDPAAPVARHPLRRRTTRSTNMKVPAIAVSPSGTITPEEGVESVPLKDDEIYHQATIMEARKMDVIFRSSCCRTCILPDLPTWGKCSL